MASPEFPLLILDASHRILRHLDQFLDRHGRRNVEVQLRPIHSSCHILKARKMELNSFRLLSLRRKRTKSRFSNLLGRPELRLRGKRKPIPTGCGTTRSRHQLLLVHRFISHNGVFIGKVDVGNSEACIHMCKLLSPLLWKRFVQPGREFG